MLRTTSWIALAIGTPPMPSDPTCAVDCGNRDVTGRCTAAVGMCWHGCNASTASNARMPL